MAAVTPVPFAIALLLGLALFGALTWYLVQEARRPVNWSAVDARTIRAASPPQLSHLRIAAVCVVFALWSLWATARPVSGWR